MYPGMEFIGLRRNPPAVGKRAQWIAVPEESRSKVLDLEDSKIIFAADISDAVDILLDRYPAPPCSSYFRAGSRYDASAWVDLTSNTSPQQRCVSIPSFWEFTHPLYRFSVDTPDDCDKLIEVCKESPDNICFIPCHLLKAEYSFLRSKGISTLNATDRTLRPPYIKLRYSPRGAKAQRTRQNRKKYNEEFSEKRRVTPQQFSDLKHVLLFGNFWPYQYHTLGQIKHSVCGVIYPLMFGEQQLFKLPLEQLASRVYMYIGPIWRVQPAWVERLKRLADRLLTAKLCLDEGIVKPNSDSEASDLNWLIQECKYLNIELAPPMAAPDDRKKRAE